MNSHLDSILNKKLEILENKRKYLYNYLEKLSKVQLKYKVIAQNGQFCKLFFILLKSNKWY